MVFGGSQFGRRHAEHRDAEQGDDCPHEIGRRSCGQDGVERAAVDVAQAGEATVDQPGKAVVLHTGLEHFGAHDRRNGQRDNARDKDRTGQGEGELAEEGAGQTALEADRRIDHGQGDGHGNDRTDQLARTLDRGIEGFHAFGQMPFDIFDHHDGVIDHDADAQNNGQKGQQIDREPGHLHEEKCADDGQGNGGDRHDHGPQRAHEEKDDRDHDKQGLGQSLEHFIDRVADVDRGIVADTALQAGW